MIKDKLFQLKDEKYKVFHARLVPGMNNNIGVRTPDLRRLAKQIANKEGLGYLSKASDDSYEEIVLQGFVIGYTNCDLKVRLEAIDSFLDKIDNWSCCDLFVSTLKFAKKNQEEIWPWLMDHLKSDNVYQIRFVLVMLLSYFLNDTYIHQCIVIFDTVTNDDYYVKMAIAWAISIAYIKYPKEIKEYLKDNHLDDWTYNKALQKMIESYRVANEDKDILRRMKR